MVDLVSPVIIITEENILSGAMAVPKKRRSKSKGRTRLSNWKKKSKTAAMKAFSAAKNIFAKEKKAAESLDNEEKVINSSDSTSKAND